MDKYRLELPKTATRGFLANKAIAAGLATGGVQLFGGGSPLSGIFTYVCLLIPGAPQDVCGPIGEVLGTVATSFLSGLLTYIVPNKR